ncbi:MAG TPA: iron-containing alcohol dehydrogenase [Gaiella sp.]|nr:iron-containing alcohol dehydrogenase [Gaiella sp.]
MTVPVTPFHAHLPVRIAFGDGVLAELPEVLSALGAWSVLVVVEEPVAEHPSVVAALAAAEGAGRRIDRVVKGPGEPTFALADELAARVRDGTLDAVVGIGGGSALDVAKAARIVADQGGAVADYASGARVPEPPRIGLVLCPTTAGTGSEVSGASVLTDTEADRKIGFGHPNMRSQHALVDPVLTHGLPAAPTAHSGVDALAQAIGACTVRNSSPLSVAFGLEACYHVAHSLREAVSDGTDAVARRRLACASLTAGLAMNLSDCAADHALGQALGGVAHLPHGLTIGLVVAETLELSRADCADRLERVADALGEPADGSGDGSRAVRAVRRVLRDVGFPTLAETGVAEDALPALVASATGDQSYNLEIDCHDWTAAEVEQAYRAALALQSR